LNAIGTVVHQDGESVIQFRLKKGLFLPNGLKQEDAMKQSDHFIENADNCAQLAERATDEPTHQRYRRMGAAWRALAKEQDWLDGETPLDPTTTNGDRWKETPPE
jgi:hypothetical protein